MSCEINIESGPEAMADVLGKICADRQLIRPQLCPPGGYRKNVCAGCIIADAVTKYLEEKESYVWALWPRIMIMLKPLIENDHSDYTPEMLEKFWRIYLTGHVVPHFNEVKKEKEGEANSPPLESTNSPEV